MSDPQPAPTNTSSDAWLRLICADLSNGVRSRLIDALGSPDHILGASPATWRAAGAQADDLNALAQIDMDRVRNAATWLAAPDHYLLTHDGPLWPESLRDIPDAPVAFFVDGDPSLLAMPALAIVGSRNPTPQGADNAQQFARYLARQGLVIVSGLATGIDASAHRGALAADGATIAVLGTGIDQYYPSSNRDLQVEIARAGCVVSEYAPGRPAVAGQFPARNRIISGLALGTLVVEATRRSGSLITARLAGEQGRSVFAIPGSIHNPLSRGCHQLIRQGALLVESADDIFSDIGPRLSEATAAAPIASDSSELAADQAPDADYQRVLDALGWDPQGIDILAERTALTPAELSSMLLIMELDGLVAKAPGGGYIRGRR
ncbi:MAG: DNA-processing protein DprA [Pseudomonadota bacterium]